MFVFRVCKVNKAGGFREGWGSFSALTELAAASCLGYLLLSSDSLLQQPGPKKFKLSKIELIYKANSLKFPRSLSKLRLAWVWETLSRGLAGSKLGTAHHTVTIIGPLLRA